ncbi:hypothetical protein CJ030_MR1G014029 [Morella rubra]|uniref:Uncharacterized protein n=1 Tax=Morella rubra TaxID=262757 RepID=A0A6A1WI05_9ROSI|nr:hypothetical protein CJ030_MR1G014029 [Morella rubra]
MLYISGGSTHLISFPEMMLPASLTSLNFGRFPNLEYLASKGFQKLSSLERLTISGCGKLTSLSKDGLPPSIVSLEIYNCPLLEQRCKKEGQEWSKIAHIPYVESEWWILSFEFIRKGRNG